MYWFDSLLQSIQEIQELDLALVGMAAIITVQIQSSSLNISKDWNPVNLVGNDFL